MLDTRVRLHRQTVHRQHRVSPASYMVHAAQQGVKSKSFNAAGNETRVITEPTDAHEFLPARTKDD